MTTKQLLPKVYVIAHRSDSHEAISEELKQEPMELVPFKDERDYFASLDKIQAGCVLVEVSENPQDELKTIAAIRARQQRMQVIAFGDQWTVSSAVRAIKLGAIDICEFPTSGQELKTAIRQAFVAEFQESRQLSHMIPESILGKLNAEEVDILRLIVQGRTAKEIGTVLDMSVRTFHYRKKTLLQKLEVSDRSEVIELIRESIGSTNLME